MKSAKTSLNWNIYGGKKWRLGEENIEMLQLILAFKENRLQKFGQQINVQNSVHIVR